MRDEATVPLIFKLLSIDGLTTGSICFCEIPALAHEARDDAMENAAFEGQWLPGLAFALLSGAQAAEVLCCFGIALGKKLHLDTLGLIFANLHAKKHLRVLLRCCFRDRQLLHVGGSALAKIALEELEGDHAKQSNRHRISRGLLPRPLQTFSRGAHLHELQLKKEGCIGRDGTACPFGSICYLAGDPNLPSVARPHHQQGLLEAWHQC
mmetsp:Transcript_97329/g.231568  ORF Transcript_97329/g.231568 Transcript_97329/m.231568 type:complete len:209 (-) Transcript_97329:225-851(-)